MLPSTRLPEQCSLKFTDNRQQSIVGIILYSKIDTVPTPMETFWCQNISVSSAFLRFQFFLVFVVLLKLLSSSILSLTQGHLRYKKEF